MRVAPPGRRRFSDDVDELERLPHVVGTPRPLTRPRGLAPPGPSLLERDRIRIATPWRVPFKNEVTVINRRIAKGQTINVPKRGLIARAAKSPISAQRPTAKPALARPPKPVVSAKAIAADRRFQNFSTFPKNVNGTFASIVPKHNMKLRFLLPWQVLPCIQRATRREVLFAQKNAGGRGSRRSPRRRSPYSSIGC